MGLAEYVSLRPEWEGSGKRGRPYEKVEVGQVRFVFHSAVRDRFGNLPGTADLRFLTRDQHAVLRAHFAADAINIDLSKLSPEQIDAFVDATFNLDRNGDKKEDE